MATPLLMIAAVVVLGIGAQWVAWRTRLPSILLLLAAGVLAGPATGFIPQGTILFEGGLTLRSDEFREVGTSDPRRSPATRSSPSRTPAPTRRPCGATS